MGMKREAVQEERQRTKERDQSEVESTSSLHSDMPIERILEAEKRVECKMEQQGNYEVNINEKRRREKAKIVRVELEQFTTSIVRLRNFIFRLNALDFCYTRLVLFFYLFFFLSVSFFLIKKFSISS